VLNQLSTTPWRCMGEWMYSSTTLDRGTRWTKMILYGLHPVVCHLRNNIIWDSCTTNNQKQNRHYWVNNCFYLLFVVTKKCWHNSVYFVCFWLFALRLSQIISFHEWSASHLSSLTPGGNQSYLLLVRRLGGSHSQSRCCGEEKILLPLPGI
jgi:hypothetical protein